MKNSLKLITATCLTFGGFTGASVFAKTDVSAAMKRLQSNEANSKENLNQYKTNKEISHKNAEEVTKAVKELRSQRKALVDNSQNLEKNRLILEEMKKKIAGFKAHEQEILKTEAAQKAQLQALIDKLESNRVQRQQNIASYDAKIQEIETEKNSWEQQKSEMAAIQQEINTKEKIALEERAKWLEKYKGYSLETQKWDRQAASAKETRIKFEQLNK